MLLSRLRRSMREVPEDWCSNIPAGTFATGQLPDVPGAKLVVGWFNDTLTDFLANHPTRWRSCIWMQTSTRRQPPSPEHVGPRLRPGSMIVFDEYFNYRGWDNTSIAPGRSSWRELESRVDTLHHR